MRLNNYDDVNKSLFGPLLREDIYRLLVPEMKNHLSTEGSVGAGGFGAAAGILSASSLLQLWFPSKVAFFLQVRNNRVHSISALCSFVVHQDEKDMLQQ